MIKEEVEIEYKQLLNGIEYARIEKYLLQLNCKILNHENFYFDNLNRELKLNNKALRIRVTADYKEICLKTQRESDILEQNILISDSEFQKIYADNSLLKDYLNEIPKGVKLLGSLKTKRIEHNIEDGLICLDKSSYDNIEDYEIEFEAKDYGKEAIFIEFLKEFDIEYKPNKKSKIQRFSERVGL